MKKIILLSFALILCLKNYSQTKFAHVTVNISGKEKKGLLNESGELILPAIYDYIFADSTFYFVGNDSLWGCLDEKGQIVLPIKYQDISWKISEGLVRIKNNNKWGFVNLKDSVIVGFNYDFACNFYSGKAYVKNNADKFYINRTGEKLSNTNEDMNYCLEDVDTTAEIKNQFDDKLLIPQKEAGKFGVLVKKTKQIIIPFEYDEIGLYNNNIILVRSGNMWGAYTDQGKLITVPKYSSIGLFWD
ncbi:MAG: WG repeat-containing protein, partial [Bacteroidia bacterium]|nr:WG repeat-containing protein [Bacteroidia bacterium]